MDTDKKAPATAPLMDHLMVGIEPTPRWPDPHGESVSISVHLWLLTASFRRTEGCRLQRRLGARQNSSGPCAAPINTPLQRLSLPMLFHALGQLGLSCLAV